MSKATRNFGLSQGGTVVEQRTHSPHVAGLFSGPATELLAALGRSVWEIGRAWLVCATVCGLAAGSAVMMAVLLAPAVFAGIALSWWFA